MIYKTNFSRLFKFKNQTFKDNRGYFKEILEKIQLNKISIYCYVIFKKNVVRGLHIQTKNPQGKFISVLRGKIFDVALDLRKNSKTFGKYYKCILDEKNSNSIFIPHGFAHGFQALDKENYIIYSCTKYREAKHEVAINFNDKDLNIKWPLVKKIASKKDKKGISFLDYKKKYL